MNNLKGKTLRYFPEVEDVDFAKGVYHIADAAKSKAFSGEWANVVIEDAKNTLANFSEEAEKVAKTDTSKLIGGALAKANAAKAEATAKVADYKAASLGLQSAKTVADVRKLSTGDIVFAYYDEAPVWPPVVEDVKAEKKPSKAADTKEAALAKAAAVANAS